MKRSLSIVGSLLLALNGWALQLGDAIPSADTKMKNATPATDVGAGGKELSIADAKGEKGTLVIFSCNHCPFVKAWEGRIAALGNEYLKKGVGVVQINSNEPGRGDDFESMQQRAKEREFAFPYVVDATSDVARSFGATRTPEVFLFDAAGKLVYHGTIDDNYQQADQAKEHYLRDALAAVADGKPVANKETKAIGCTIKFRGKS